MAPLVLLWRGFCLFEKLQLSQPNLSWSKGNWGEHCQSAKFKFIDDQETNMACEMEFEIVGRNTGFIESSAHQNYQNFHGVENLHAAHFCSPKIATQRSKLDGTSAATWSTRNGKRKIDSFQEISTRSGEQLQSCWLNSTSTKAIEPIRKRPCLECFSNDDSKTSKYSATLGNSADVPKQFLKSCHRCEAGEGGHLGHISS
ncbi:uncharacterized protein LOC135681268 [Rhopilema esculentum]|uniref:uncharacterized protein LOC135681268 n=1 Tax=Rhopilema esculentum TaxID=499914 RepID=UPI0031D1AE8B